MKQMAKNEDNRDAYFNLINESIPNEKSLWNENNDFVPGPVSTNFMLYIGIQANYL